MLNKKKIKNNYKLACNVSLLQGLTPNTRALVLTSPKEGILESAYGTPFQITDFFNVVIAADLATAKSLPFADFVVYSSESPYRNNQMHLEEYAQLSDSIICTNYYAIDKVKSLKRSLKISNINFLPAECEPAATPGTIREVGCGLSSASPGEHLAMLLGCSSIMVDPVDLESFVTEKEKGPYGIEKHLPTNIITPRRRPFIKNI